MADDALEALERQLGTKPEIVVSSRHLDEIADDITAVLVEQNTPPDLFVHADTVSLLADSQLHPLDHEALLDVLERRTRPVAVKKDETRPSRYPADLRKVVLRRLKTQLPELVALAPAPFVRGDGTICQTAGYDEQTRLYLLDALNVDVPDRPTVAALADAVNLIDELLADFPLPTPADRAHAYSMIITPLIRHLVALAPLHYIDGNNAGVGKNLLAETGLGIWYGTSTEERIPTDPMPGDGEEMRKQITSHCAEGRRIVLWDEAHYIVGTQLARLLTSTTWSDRYLGSNVTIRARNMITAVALGNQVEVLGDLRRRVVRISLHSLELAPSRRDGFRHADLRGWADRNRSALLSAVLTLVRAWYVAGQPQPAVKPLGSFEAWTNIVGGVLEHAGIDGFLATAAEVLDDGDYLDAEFAEFVTDLATQFGTAEFTTRQIMQAAKADDLDLPSSVDPFDRDGADRLGKLMRKYKGRPVGAGYILRKAGTTGNRTRWTVEPPTEKPVEVPIGRDRYPSPDPATSVSEAASPLINTEKPLCVESVIPTYPYLSLPHDDSGPKTTLEPAAGREVCRTCRADLNGDGYCTDHRCTEAMF